MCFAFREARQSFALSERDIEQKPTVGVITFLLLPPCPPHATELPTIMLPVLPTANKMICSMEGDGDGA